MRRYTLRQNAYEPRDVTNKCTHIGSGKSWKQLETNENAWIIPNFCFSIGLTETRIFKEANEPRELLDIRITNLQLTPRNNDGEEAAAAKRKYTF